MSAMAHLAGERKVSGHAGNPPGQGPFLIVHLTIRGDLVSEATYETYQCPACHDCGKAICRMVKDRPIHEADKVTWEPFVAQVGPLPRNQSHCYGLALLALAEALKCVGTPAAGEEAAGR